MCGVSVVCLTGLGGIACGLCLDVWLRWSLHGVGVLLSFAPIDVILCRAHPLRNREFRLVLRDVRSIPGSDVLCRYTERSVAPMWKVIKTYQLRGLDIDDKHNVRNKGEI